MRKWLLVALTVGLAGLLALGQVYPRNETLYVSGAAWGPPTDWNPFITWSKANTSGTVGLIYETLYFYDPINDELIPWLAESGDWRSDTVFVVKLRDGITWQDGTPLTAEDVVFTFELGRKYAEIWFSPRWDYLASVTAVDPLTVEFSFKGTVLYQEFQSDLYNVAIVPEHIWAGRSREDITSGANGQPVGSGAYRYLTHAQDRNVYVRNEDWWGTKLLGLKPAPKFIVEILFSSNNVALGSLLKGELDLSNNFLPGIGTLTALGYVKTYLPQPPYMLSANTAVLFLNTTKKPLDDPAFRKALAHAINVDDIINYAFAGLVQRADPTGLLPTMSKYVDQGVVARLGFAYNPAQARQLLAAAGYREWMATGLWRHPTVPRSPSR